ncbi:MAG: winged helix DNA-binding protein [Saprospiraceae bacterium]|nr:winged helix DNA-binding protein [Saprospiraceae bacterium]
MNYIEILVKLRKIIRSINLESKKIEKAYGISIPQLLTLQFLSGQQEYRALARDIKEYLNLNASTVTGIITRLEEKNLVVKVPRKDDRRGSYVILTAKGSELLAESPTTLQEKFSIRLKELTTEQIADLDRNIEVLTRLLDAGDLDAAPIITNEEL